MEFMTLFRRVALLLLSVPFWLLGLLFIISSFDPSAAAQGKVASRIILGGLMVIAALLFTVIALIPSKKAGAGTKGGVPVTQQEPPGQLNIKKIKCQNCGADLDPNSAVLGSEGTMSYSCPYCGGTFLLEEAPKW